MSSSTVTGPDGSAINSFSKAAGGTAVATSSTIGASVSAADASCANHAEQRCLRQDVRADVDALDGALGLGGPLEGGHALYSL